MMNAVIMKLWQMVMMVALTKMITLFLMARGIARWLITLSIPFLPKGRSQQSTHHPKSDWSHPQRVKIYPRDSCKGCYHSLRE